MASTTLSLPNPAPREAGATPGPRDAGGVTAGTPARGSHNRTMHAGTSGRQLLRHGRLARRLASEMRAP